MSALQTYDVPERVRTGSNNLMDSLLDYYALQARVQADPDGFWIEQTRNRIDWRKAPSIGLQGDFRTLQEGPLTWFADGVLNVTESCLDRHVATQPDRTAILWESDEPGQSHKLTYAELHAQVCQAAGALQALGVGKGDRVIIYMGMVPQAAIAMLATARLGAVHSVVFGGFSADALRDRIQDCDAKVVITQDEGVRAGRTIPLKATADEAVAQCPGVEHVLVYRRVWTDTSSFSHRDVDWSTALLAQPSTFEAVPCSAEDPLFILYTSGSTGKPKGLVHTCGGYITWATFTHREVFDLRDDDVFACAADVGWITGHSYIVYGPLSNGTTTVMFESTPLYPDAGRYWRMVEEHGITVFYTAPTAIRALAAQGDAYVETYDLSSLRVLGTVGEPINPDAWEWYHRVVGKGRCSIVDTWWQTETGGIMISPLAAVTAQKPGSATLPIPGIEPLLVDEQGQQLRGPSEGRLCIRHPWPGMARTIWGNHERYVQTYFSTYPPYYFTGDGCRRDSDGYHWITGRVDDVINVSGHRLGTAEFESVLVSHEVVAEAAVVGFPHDIKGQGVYAYVVLQPGQEPSTELENALHAAVRRQIGAVARVDIFQFVPGLPKTRSGKVMRRILRKIAEGEPDRVGDVSTLADPEVVEAIKAGAMLSA